MSWWLDRLLRRRKPAPAPLPPAPPLTPEQLERARRAGREVLGLTMAALKDSRGIHLESLYCALGALAGLACQESVRSRAIADGKLPEAYFSVATTKVGDRYFFGDALNQPLAEDRLSLWSLVVGAAAHDGATQLPDLQDIFRHNAAALGTPQFGLPRLPTGHPVQKPPLDYARQLWPEASRVLAESAGEPRAWPVAVALGIQELMNQAQGQVPPGLVVRIVMESAVPVSKVPFD